MAERHDYLITVPVSRGKMIDVITHLRNAIEANKAGDTGTVQSALKNADKILTEQLFPGESNEEVEKILGSDQ